MKVYNVQHDLWYKVIETDLDAREVRTICQCESSRQGQRAAERIADLLSIHGLDT